MIKPSDIAKHLSTFISIFTDLFSDNLIIDSASVGADNIITVNSTNHGLTNGQAVVVSSGLIRNNILSVSLDTDTGIATIETEFNHNLVTPKLRNDPDKVILFGFTPLEWNDEFTLIEAVDRKNFKVQTSFTANPTITGYIKEQRNILGFRDITVIDSDSFTYDASDTQPLPQGQIGNLKVISGYRIYIVANLERANEIYTARNSDEYCMFVLFGDVDISKDRHTNSDLTAGFTPQDMNLLRLITNFQTLVYIPTDNDVGGVTAHEMAYGEVFESLISVFQGFGFADNETSIPYVTVSNGHGPENYNPGYYLHVYDWQAPSALTVESSFPVKIGAVTEIFNQITQSWAVNNNAQDKLTNTLIL